MLVLILLLLAGCKETVLHDLDEQDANRVISALDDSAILPAKTRQPDGRWSVEVNQEDLISAVKHLERVRALNRAPRPDHQRSSLLPNRDQQRLEYSRELAKEIEYTLGSIQGVLEARVHINLPILDPIFGADDDQGSSASVLLVVSSGFKEEQRGISNLVGLAAGIPPERVSILFNARLSNKKNRQALQKALPDQSIRISQQLISYASAGFAVFGIIFVALGIRSLRRTDESAG